MRDRDERVAGIIQHLDIVQRFQIHRICRPFHAELDVLVDLDDVGIERGDAKPFCCYRPVMTVYKDRPAGTPHNDNGFGKSFFNLVDPPFQLVFVDLGLGRQEVGLSSL